jgi:hypothetical protein
MTSAAASQRTAERAESRVLDPLWTPQCNGASTQQGGTYMNQREPPQSYHGFDIARATTQFHGLDLV